MLPRPSSTTSNHQSWISARDSTIHAVGMGFVACRYEPWRQFPAQGSTYRDCCPDELVDQAMDAGHQQGIHEGLASRAKEAVRRKRHFSQQNRWCTVPATTILLVQLLYCNAVFMCYHHPPGPKWGLMSCALWMFHAFRQRSWGGILPQVCPKARRSRMTLLEKHYWQTPAVPRRWLL